ncbi:MAG: hypothetical protein ACI3ZP_09800 [Candidatus Cryptobacteroides sp.]
MKSNFVTSALYRRAFKRILKRIMSKVNEAEELWEIDEEMDLLWKLGDKGAISAFIAYALVLLRDDKSWYNPDEALTMLESLSEDGFSSAQYLLGSLKFNGIKSVAADKVSGLYWIRKAAASGSPEAQAFMKLRSEGC